MIRLLLNPWFLALSAGAVAALMGWVALQQRDAKRDAQVALRAAERAQEQLGEFLTQERALTIRLTDNLGELANVPDSQVCVDSPSIGVLPGLLRNQRDNP